MLARHDTQALCLSVYLSVTSQSSVKTTEHVELSLRQYAVF